MYNLGLCEGPIEEKSQAKPFTIRVFEKDQGKRLDQFLSEAEPHLSRSQAKRLIEAQFIRLNERPTKPSVHVKTGDQITGVLPQPTPLSLEPEAIPLSILYEDSSIIVIDKPPGMVVHPAAGNPTGTLVNALIYHCKDLAGINGVLRPGIVHRLDKDTSGVIVVAKNDGAYRHLTKQFKNRIVEKVYLAVAYGTLGKEEGSIDSDIGRHPSERKRMSTRTKRGRPALTQWRVLERFKGVTLLELFPKTGRTHQIRVSPRFNWSPHLGGSSLWKEKKTGSH